MKRLVICAIALLMLGLLSTSTLAVGLQGSPHNFLANSNVPGIAAVTNQGDELCSPCHVPHNATQKEGLLASDYGYTDGTLDKKSFLCMSCHDGNMARGTATYTIPGASTLSSSNSHKVNVPIPSDDPTNYNSSPNLPLSDTGMVTCGSCHDPHGTGKMLRKSNANSALCTECHRK